jgi:hypothetical protein
MSLELVIDLKEWQGVQDLLEKVTPRAASRAFGRVNKISIEKVLKAMQMNIDSRVLRHANPGSRLSTGRLKNSLKIIKTKKYEPNFMKTSVGVDMGKKRGDKTGAYYWHMVEFGHEVVPKGKSRSRRKGLRFQMGKKTRPMEFAIDGLESNADSIKSKYASEVTSALRKAFNRKANRK